MAQNRSTTQALYLNHQVRDIDYTAIHRLPAHLRIDGYALMCRAGLAAFKQLRQHWPTCQSLLVFTGPGNNGGDAWVVAKLAHQAGISVQVIFISAPTSQSCIQAAADYHAAGGTSKAVDFQMLDQDLAKADCLVDGLLGSGFSGVLRGDYPQLIQMINAANKPLLALDIPSGLNGDNGVASASTIVADLTISFIAATLGLFTADASHFTGKVIVEDLQLPAQAFLAHVPVGHLLDSQLPKSLIQPRHGNSYKNHHGHLLLAGGSQNMGGAILLAATAAAKTGAGLVSSLVNDNYCPAFTAAHPGIMFAGWKSADLQLMLNKANALVIGPGMGQSSQAQQLVSALIDNDLPKVIDADALNLLASQAALTDKLQKNAPLVITPHPGEAARLLNISTIEVQSDRLSAVKLLQQKFGGVAVLKGAGSLIYDGQQLWCCPFGNPGMAVAGMGDLLAGIIGSFLAQGHSALNSACLGVLIHAQAGDIAADAGQIGLQAVDLLPSLRGLVNPTC
ncbi:NAD(P)H-hydrate dehydratase [Pelagibaculum spongiae]|nr:NAD(P)H-hydrate dehydratase [Pelagibaculum spongiae]